MTILLHEAEKIAALIVRRHNLTAFITAMESDTSSGQPWGVVNQQGQMIGHLEPGDATEARRACINGVRAVLNKVNDDLTTAGVDLPIPADRETNEAGKLN